MRRPPDPARAARPRERLGPVARHFERRLGGPSPVRREEVLRRQAGLAERVASFLRDQGQDARVGLAAGALLVAAAGAALIYDVATEPTLESVELAPVVPLTQEVREGLPAAPGTYRVNPESVTRDAQGVHRFGWYEPGPAGPERLAAVSLLKLAPGESDKLEVPAAGDPILHLRESTPVQMVAAAAAPAGTASSSGTTSTSRPTGGYGYHPIWIGNWYPYTGSYTREPVYRSPPTRTLDGRAVGGSIESRAPVQPAQRTIAVPPRADAVSGMARGTGGGTAVTARAGGGTARPSVATAKSSSFSSGVGSSSGSSIS